MSILVVLFSSWLLLECFQELVPELDPLKSNEMSYIFTITLHCRCDVIIKVCLQRDVCGFRILVGQKIGQPRRHISE